MSHVYSALVRFKIFDEYAQLSLTNIMLMVLIGKVAFSPIDWTQLVALFMALLSYNGKRVLKHKERKEEEATTDKIARIEEQMTVIKSSVSMKNVFGK